MRHFSALLLVVTALSARATTSSFTIVASFYPVYIATKNVTRDAPGVDLRSLAPPTTGCLHDYQLTPADILLLERADVLVLNGAGMEPMLASWIKQHPHLPVIDSSEGIPLIMQSSLHAHLTCHHPLPHEQEHPCHHPVPNPHYWLSVTRHMRQVENIAMGLAAADPLRAAYYLTNAASYVATLRHLRCELRRILADLPQRELITMHDAFPYFAQEFGFTIIAVIQSEPGQAPSARRLAELAQLIRAKGLRAIFAEPQYSDAPARTLARETGAAVAMLDPIVTGPDDLDAYCAAMRRNAQTLRTSLTTPLPALSPPPHISKSLSPNPADTCAADPTNACFAK
ncbi:MAG: zinc ABC transporter substrate-binding protein [bacterium]|nr:zinc ABC transporter substrate-binding protein [bacterium]